MAAGRWRCVAQLAAQIVAHGTAERCRLARRCIAQDRAMDGRPVACGRAPRMRVIGHKRLHHMLHDSQQRTGDDAHWRHDGRATLHAAVRRAWRGVVRLQPRDFSWWRPPSGEAPVTS
ncbi:pentatricopeptide repeat-containing protein [Dorcoceras hygrometricum]|uniref:Pentatricopeptide repeat-containing protein n=1 Tax=Dorcoceras hygrometricum TaxID=472368 RepID=A0A2Z7A1Q3_9LAMI|nr:pentatricopeptide repeat-containing protein [Dorcoceras hygrometricum]